LKGFADVWSIFISAFYFKQFEGEDGDRHEELIYKDESVCSSKKRPETIGNVVVLFLHSAIITMNYCLLLSHSKNKNIGVLKFGFLIQDLGSVIYYLLASAHNSLSNSSVYKMKIKFLASVFLTVWSCRSHMYECNYLII
jgi:hypothetical protein